MLDVSFEALARPIERVLVIGCHSDDIEIGCGGTLLQLGRVRPRIQLTWVVLSASGERAREARGGATAFGGAANLDLRLHEFRDGYLPYLGGSVKDAFEELKSVDPDIVFTHARDDLHQDHRLACELTWNTFREHLILEYEVPKYDGDLASPNVFVPLGEQVVDEKLRLLRESFPSQGDKHWFDAELFRGLMRLRGVESATSYAEAFTCRKLRVCPP